MTLYAQLDEHGEIAVSEVEIGQECPPDDRSAVVRVARPPGSDPVAYFDWSDTFRNRHSDQTIRAVGRWLADWFERPA